MPFYLRATAACGLGEWDVEPSCPEYQRFATARRRVAPQANLASHFAQVARPHLRHPSPVVRMLAGQLAVADLAVSLEPLLQSIEAETEPLVARAQIRLVLHAGRAQPQALLAAVAAGSGSGSGSGSGVGVGSGAAACGAGWGEKPCQRADLAQWASWWWQRANGPGQLVVRAEAAAQWAESLALAKGQLAPARLASACAQLAAAVTAAEEPEQGVLCVAAGLACPAAVGPLLSGAALSDQVAEHCVAGALQSWCRAPAYDTADPAGYALVLAELQRQPRGDQRPSWRWLQALACAKPLAQPPGPGDPLASWRARVTFADLRPLLAALRQVVEDPSAGGHSRAEALRTARDLGAPPAWLKAWKTRWGQAEFGVEGQLRRALQ